MRERLKQVLESDDKDEVSTDAVVRRFWARAKPLAGSRPRSDSGCVIDMAQWAQARSRGARV
jgi:hypothetical protein